MKRFSALIGLLLCLILLSGCGTEEVLQKMLHAENYPSLPSPTAVTAGAESANETSAETTPTPLPTPLPSPGQTFAPAEATSSPTPQVAGESGIPNYASLTADVCVQDAWNVPGVIPRIVLDCPGADSLNDIIYEQFRANAEDPLWSVHYECEIGAHRFLSILMVKQSADTRYHTAYNLDMATGHALTGEELLAALGQDAGTVKNLEVEVMAEEFTHQYGMMQGQIDEDLYSQQYAKTTAIDNAELDNLWFGANNELYFVGKIYPLAGASYYEYPLATGLIF